jgi:hypothetical protein
MLNVFGFIWVVRLGIVAVAASYVAVSYLLMPLYFLMIRKLIGVSIRSHLMQYGPAAIGSVVMVAIVSVFKLALGEEIIAPVRLVVLIFIGALTYLLTLRLSYKLEYQQMMGVAQSALGGFLSW